MPELKIYRPEDFPLPFLKWLHKRGLTSDTQFMKESEARQRVRASTRPEDFKDQPPVWRPVINVVEVREV